jgi:hypothetical protein
MQEKAVCQARSATIEKDKKQCRRDGGVGELALLQKNFGQKYTTWFPKLAGQSRTQRPRLF